MAWIDKVTFTLTHTDGTQVIVPEVEDFRYSFVKEDEDDVFYRAKPDTELLLTGDDFEYLNDIQAGANKCDPITLTVELECGGTDTMVFTGVFRTSDCDFDLDDCTATIKPFANDDYVELYENWETEYNILSGTTRTTVRQIYGDLETDTCFDLAFVGSPSTLPPWEELDSCLSSPGDGWVLLRTLIRFEDPGPDIVASTWVREKVTGEVPEPPGGGWIDLGGGDWAREPDLTEEYTIKIDTFNGTEGEFDAYFGVVGADIIVASSGIEISDAEDNGYEELATGADEGDLYYKKAVYDNGVLLEELLDHMMPISGGSIVSDFFSINGDATAPSNDSYTDAAANLVNLVFHQIADVSNWDAFQNTTKGIMTFKFLLEYLKKKFDVRWTVTGTVIRVEHISYFENAQGLDLTSSAYEAWIEKTNKFSHKAPPVRYEYFKGMESPVTDYFEGLNIEYTNCTGEDFETNDFNIPDFMHDLGYTQGNADDIQTKGFFVFATEERSGSYYAIFNNGYANGKLSTTYVHDKHWRWRREQAQGYLNGVLETFETYKPDMIQIPLIVQFANCSALVNYDPALEMKTGLGWGEVQQVSISLKNCSMNLSLRHGDS